MSKVARPAAVTAVQQQVGQRIIWVREALDVSQAEASRMIRVSPSTLNKIEKGDRAASIFNIMELAIRLRVSADFLLFGTLHGRTDHELALELAARHPEIVLDPEDRVRGTQNTRQTVNKFRPPKIRGSDA